MRSFCHLKFAGNVIEFKLLRIDVAFHPFPEHVIHENNTKHAVLPISGSDYVHNIMLDTMLDQFLCLFASEMHWIDEMRE